MTKWSRRHFLTTFSSGILGFGLTKNSEASVKDIRFGEDDPSSLKIKKYNPLGKTGLKISDVSCGAIALFEPNVLRYAYDLGVNYFDTAEGYMRTKSESLVGQALKDVRDKIVITTKHGYSPKLKIEKEKVIERIEASLKRLQSDYIDVALVHGADDLHLLENDELQAAYSQMKKEGKIRFTGFSTHNAKKTLKQALTNDFAQVVLVIYNHLEGKEIEPLLEQVRKKGIGTVAMKVFAGGKHGNLKSLISKEVSYPQAAIRWVLNNPNIDSLIVTFSSYSHVEEYVAASGKPLNRADLGVIRKYQRQVQNQYCRVSCKDCLPACPGNVAINDVLRYGMYFEDYGMQKEAMRYYSELEAEKKPLLCPECKGNCVSACPFGLEIRDKLIHAHEILSV